LLGLGRGRYLHAQGILVVLAIYIGAADEIQKPFIEPAVTDVLLLKP
jgi:hypothetical protein